MATLCLAYEMAPPRQQKQAAQELHHLQLTVDSLRKQLKSAKLSTVGNKKILIERLGAHLSQFEKEVHEWKDGKYV